MSFLGKLAGGFLGGSLGDLDSESLFGGSGTQIYGPQEEYLKDLWGRAQGQLGQSTVAPQTQQFQDYLQSVGDFGQQAQGMQQQAMGQAGQYGQIGGQAQDYLSNVLGQGGFQAPMQQGVDMGAVGSMINNPLLDQQIQASTRDIGRNLWEQQMPGIASQAVGTGNVGSTRRGVAEGIAQRGASDRTSDVAAQMRGQAYGQALGIGAQQAGANQQAQLSSNQLNQQLASGTFGQAGQLGQGSLGQAYGFGMGALTPQQQAAQMSQEYAQQQTMDPWTQLQMYQGAIGNPIQQQYEKGSILGALGGVAQAAGPFIAACDERLKENIEHVATLPNGVELNTWDWSDNATELGLKGRGFGPVAQQVQEIMPEAVFSAEDGYLRVKLDEAMRSH
jgi:hypothetical protein